MVMFFDIVPYHGRYVFVLFVDCVDVLYAHLLPCIWLQVDLDLNAGIFITLNPAGKGYGGRQKLPDNLKQLFRPVAMSRPDNELIAEVLLFAEGFKQAKMLGRKLVASFSLSRYRGLTVGMYVHVGIQGAVR